MEVNVKLLTYKELQILGIRYTRDHLRVKVAAGEFPRPINLSQSRIAWVEQEVLDWVSARVAERDQHAA
jgi:prophage regulatory protein